jgi:hypothetical protein
MIVVHACSHCCSCMPVHETAGDASDAMLRSWSRALFSGFGVFRKEEGWPRDRCGGSSSSATLTAAAEGGGGVDVFSSLHQ